MRWFLPVLFISYMAGITLFTHSHVVNGVTIVHSHPFKKRLSHGHTTVEFQLIHLLSHVATTGTGIFFSLFQFIAYLLYTLSWRPDRGRDTVRPSWAWYLCGHLLPEDKTSLTALFRKIYLVILLSKMKMKKYIFFSLACAVPCCLLWPTNRNCWN